MSDELLEIAGDSAVGGFSLFLGQVVSSVVLAVGLILVARLLGPDDFGLYTLAFVVPVLLVYLVELGVDEAVIRFPALSVAEGKERVALKTVRRTLKFKLLVASVGSVVVFLLSDIFASYLLQRPELGFYLRIASLVVVAQALFNSTAGAFIGLNRMTKSAILNGVMSIVRTISAPVLIVLGLGVTGAIVGYVLGFSAAVLLGIILLTALTGTVAATIGGEEQATTIRAMVGYGFPAYLASLLRILVNQLQFVILAFFVSNVEIGNFDATLNFTALMNVLSLPVVMAMFPAFSKLNPVSAIADLRRLFAASTKYSSLFILPASAGVIVLSKELVYVIYGRSYLLAPTFLSLYGVSFLYAGIGSGVLGSFFNGIGETRSNLEIGVINTVIFFLAAPLLTPVYGTLGLITAFLASSLISILYGLYTARRKYGVGLYIGAQWRIFLATAVPALLCLGFLHVSSLRPLFNLVIGGAILIAAYLTLLPVLGAINAYDIQNLTTLFKRISLAWPIMKQVLAYEAELLAILGQSS